jgi:hypothetical protein
MIANLYQTRKRFLQRRCPVVLIDQDVYHGSPTQGLEEIRRAGMLHPQGHGELEGEWLSVSVNDNMLVAFSDKTKANGFISSPGKLKCVHLDWFHYALATYKIGFRNDEDDVELLEKWAERLGYTFERRRYGPTNEGICHEVLMSLMPGDVDGLIFPWSEICQWRGFCVDSWNDECEIALTPAGCRKVWDGIHTLYLDGEEYEPKKAWRMVTKLAAKEWRDENQTSVEFAVSP